MAWAASLLAVLLAVGGSIWRRGGPSLGHLAVLSLVCLWLLVVTDRMSKEEDRSSSPWVHFVTFWLGKAGDRAVPLSIPVTPAETAPPPPVGRRQECQRKGLSDATVH